MSKTKEEHIASLMDYDTPAEAVEAPADQLAEEVEPAPAVPEDIIDDQVAGWEKPDPAEKAKEEDFDQDWRTLYEQEKKASGGRLAEVHKLREKLSEQNDSIEQLRQIFLEREQREWEEQQELERQRLLEEEAEVYGEDVVNDPAVKYMRDKWLQTQDLIEAQRQEAEGRRRALIEASEQHRAQKAAIEQEIAFVRSQEEEFAKEHPDYNDAYEFAKKARYEMYVDMGVPPEEAIQTVRGEEAILRQSQYQRGGNIAEAVYTMAKRLGYQPKGAEKPKRASMPGDEIPNMAKLKKGVGSRGLAGMAGSGGSASGGARRISAEEFYNTVPLGKRIEIQADPDKFEELGRTGYITMD